MAKFQLSNKADNDLSQIYEYSVENFGFEKAEEYYLSFQKAFDNIMDNPLIGQDFGEVVNGLRRYEHRGHYIYYDVEEGRKIWVDRILGCAQDPMNNLNV